MERRNKIRREREKSIDMGEEDVEALLKTIEQKNRRIQALEDQIRSLQEVFSCVHVDPRYWIGLPICPFDSDSRKSSEKNR